MPQRQAAQENISVVVPVNCPWTRGTLAALIASSNQLSAIGRPTTSASRSSGSTSA
jgi:hypothetical protein